ncbi:MAG: hypothetical protein ACOC9Y_08255, partial [Chloroflexota bacterium]
MRRLLRVGLFVAALALSMSSLVLVTGAEPVADRAMVETWERTDRPVADQEVSRTWMWGPAPFTAALSEPYEGSPDGARMVQYFDKSRMEITDPDGDASSIWYVTNGLLVMELITGELQVGDDSFEAHEPADINVAGDADDTSGPTYASLQRVLHEPLEYEEGPLITRIDRDGHRTDDEALAERGVEAGHFVEETGLPVADPFWDFMQSSGLVYQDGGYQEASLFENPFFATGFPVTAPYWARVAVGGS